MFIAKAWVSMDSPPSRGVYFLPAFFYKHFAHSGSVNGYKYLENRA
jgi:hypothetical protein